MAAVKNSLAKQGKKQAFSAFVTQDAVKRRINQMVGSKDGQRFITSMISAVSVNPDLSECDFPTILSAAMLGESLKLSPSPQLGQYYMIPFKDYKNDRTVATFVLGYKGYIQLAIRSGYYKKINAIALKEGELVGYDPLNEEIDAVIINDWDAREAAPIIGYYAMFEYLNGFRKGIYWSKEQMLAHADKYAPAFSRDAVKGKNPKYDKVSFADFKAGKVKEKDMWLYSSFWYKDFDAMAHKTMIRQLISKWGIMSIDLQTAYERDDSIQGEDGSFEYVDNVVDTTSYDSDEEEENESWPEPPVGAEASAAQDSFFDGAGA